MLPYVVCPLSMEVMKNPVIAADRFVYERSIIEAWLSTHGISPLTRTVFVSKDLVDYFAFLGT